MGRRVKLFHPRRCFMWSLPMPHTPRGDELVHLGRQKLQIGSGVEPAFAGKLHVRPEEYFGFAVDPEPAILKRGKAFLIVFGDGADEAFAHLSFRGNGQAARGFDDGVFQQQAGGQAVPSRTISPPGTFVSAVKPRRSRPMVLTYPICTEIWTTITGRSAQTASRSWRFMWRLSEMPESSYP